MIVCYKQKYLWTPSIPSYIITMTIIHIIDIIDTIVIMDYQY